MSSSFNPTTSTDPNLINTASSSVSPNDNPPSASSSDDAPQSSTSSSYDLLSQSASSSVAPPQPPTSSSDAPPQPPTSPSNESEGQSTISSDSPKEQSTSSVNEPEGQSTSLSDSPQEQSTISSVSPQQSSTTVSSGSAVGPIASAFPNISTDLLEKIQESLNSLTDAETIRVPFYYRNLSLVICEDDFIFNNRWFHSIGGPANSDLVNRLEVLMRTPVLSIVLFSRLSKFTNLKRMKISKITFEDLLELKRVPLLEHLEIDAITVTNDCAAKLNKSVELPRLNRLKIREINNEFRSIAFLTPRLNTVYFGQKVDLLRLLFTEQLVFHCEVELLRDVADVSQFYEMKTLVCNHLLAGGIIRLVVKLIKLMPMLSEVYLNFEEFTSLTDDYGHLSKQLEGIRGIVEMLTVCKNPKNERPQVYIQGVPLLEFQKYSESTPDLLHASLLSLQFEMTKGRFASTHSLCSSMVHPSIAHVNFGKLQCKVPQLLADPKFIQLMQRKFPGLQNVEVDQESIDSPIDFELLLPFLKSLRAVQKLFFNRCDVDHLFYSIVLPAMPSLVDSLIALKIFDYKLPDELSQLCLYFLGHLKCLRYFGTNLICRDAIPYALTMVKRFPFTFTFAFKMAEIDDHALIIRKHAKDGYHAVLQERSRRRTLDTERYHELSKPSELLDQATLVRLLKEHPLCNLLLRHKYDGTKGAPRERITSYHIANVCKVYQLDHEQAIAFLNQMIDSSPKPPTKPTKRTKRSVQFSEHAQVRTFQSDLEGAEKITEQDPQGAEETTEKDLEETEKTIEYESTIQSEDQPVQQAMTESQRVLQSVAGDLLAPVASEPGKTLQSAQQSQGDKSQNRPQEASQSPPPAPSIRQMFSQAVLGSNTELTFESLKLLLSGQPSSSLLVASGSSQTDQNLDSSMADLSKALAAQGAPSAITQTPSARTSSAWASSARTPSSQAPSAQTTGTKRSRTMTKTTPAKSTSAKTAATKAPSKKAKRELLQASSPVQSSSVPPPSALSSLQQSSTANRPAELTTSAPSDQQLYASYLEFEGAKHEYLTLRAIIMSGPLPADQNQLFGEAVACANQICSEQHEASQSEGGPPSVAQRVAYFEATNKNLTNLSKFLVYFRQWASEQSLRTLQAISPTPSSTQPLAQSFGQLPAQSPAQSSVQSLAQPLAQPLAQSLAQSLAYPSAQSSGQPLILQDQFALQSALPASPLIQPTPQFTVLPTSMAQVGQGLQGYPSGQTPLYSQMALGQLGPLSAWSGPPVTQMVTPVTQTGPSFTQTGPSVTQIIQTPLSSSIIQTPVSQFVQTPTTSSFAQSPMSSSFVPSHPSLPGLSIAQTTSTYTMATPQLSSSLAPLLAPSLAVQPPPSQLTPSSQAAPVSESSSVPPSESPADSNDQTLAAIREGTFLVTLDMLQNYRTEFEGNRQAFRDLVASRGSPNLQIIHAIEQQFTDFDVKLNDCKASVEFDFGLAAIQNSQRQLVDSLHKLKKIMEAGQSMLRMMKIPTTQRR